MTRVHRSLTASLTALIVALAPGVASANPTGSPQVVDAARSSDEVVHPVAQRAFVISRRDGNDTKGALDLRSICIWKRLPPEGGTAL